MADAHGPAGDRVGRQGGVAARRAVAVLERLGYEAASAPLGNVFHPREARAEAYRSARERHQRLYEELRGED